MNSNYKIKIDTSYVHCYNETKGSFFLSGTDSKTNSISKKKFKYIGYSSFDVDFIAFRSLNHRVLSQETITFLSLKNIPNLEYDCIHPIQKFTSLVKLKIKYINFEGGKSPIETQKLSFLKKLKSLISLELIQFSPLKPQAMENISRLSSLAILSLKNCHSIQNSWLLQLANSSSITSLDLSQCKNISDRGLIYLKNLSSLQFLDLSENKKITYKGIKSLSKLPHLTTLKLNHCNQVFKKKSPLTPEFTSIIQLSLSHCELSLKQQFSLLKLPSLSYLNLKGHSDLIPEFDVIAEKPKITFLKNLYCSATKSLNLSGKQINDQDLKIATSLFPDLVAIDLSYSEGLTEEEFRNCKNFSWLSSLNVKGCENITDSFLESIEQCPFLQSLNLAGCRNISDDGLRHLISLKNLSSLNLSGCEKITKMGMRYISRLSYSLQSLNLAGCRNISDNGLGYLGILTEISSLNLSDTNTTDFALRVIKSLDKLEFLDLSSCDSITDLGIKILDPLYQLKFINLYNCGNITEFGINYMSQKVETIEI